MLLCNMIRSRLPRPATSPRTVPLPPFHYTSRPILRLSPLQVSSFSDSFNFKLSIEAPGPVRTVNLFSCGSPLTRIDAKVTRVKLKSFICHSYEKHPGVGVRLLLRLPPFSLPSRLPTSSRRRILRHPAFTASHRSLHIGGTS